MYCTMGVRAREVRFWEAWQSSTDSSRDTPIRESDLIGKVLLRIEPQSHEPVPRLVLLAFASFGVRPRRQPLPKPQPGPNVVLQGGVRLPRQVLQFEVLRVIHSEAYLAFVEGVHGDSRYHTSRRPHTPHGGHGSRI